MPRTVLQASPEFKGIKTKSERFDVEHFSLQASPEFKGIKTVKGGGGSDSGHASSQP